MVNTNTTEVLFENLSEEETASVTGGRGIVALADARADLTNNVGGVTYATTYTNVVDQGTHTSTSIASSGSLAFDDTKTGATSGSRSLDKIFGITAP
ncbi:hypothetical protein [Aetokthonos hydrillicola]|nr:hypothetical protein [Aetokthonos hydrillicola]